MVITVLMNQSMMIEGKVRESIYIVQNTCRRHEAHQYDRTASSETTHSKSSSVGRTESQKLIRLAARNILAAPRSSSSSERATNHKRAFGSG